MKITDLKMLPTKVGYRHQLIIKIETDEGIRCHRAHLLGVLLGPAGPLRVKTSLRPESRAVPDEGSLN